MGRIDEASKSLDQVRRAIQSHIGPRRRAPAQDRVLACVIDVAYFAPLVEELHSAAEESMKAVLRWSEATGHYGDISKIPGAPDNGKEVHRCGAAYKAMYFLVRSLQDATCALLYEENNMNAGRFTSMGDCLKKSGNPVGALIRQRIPAYEPWFRDFRDLRNRMKEGVSAGGSGGDDGYEVRLDCPQDRLGPEDLATALEQSTAVLSLAFEYLSLKPTADQELSEFLVGYFVGKGYPEGIATSIVQRLPGEQDGAIWKDVMQRWVASKEAVTKYLDRCVPKPELGNMSLQRTDGLAHAFFRRGGGSTLPG